MPNDPVRFRRGELVPAEWYRCEGHSDLEFGADGVSWTENGTRMIVGEPGSGRAVIVGDGFGDVSFDPPAEISWRSRDQ
jgi:hypothetical protein